MVNDAIATGDRRISLRFATADDVGLILELIHQRAESEKLSHEVEANEDLLRRTLFGERRAAEVVIADYEGEPAGFALFVHNFSAVVAQPGIQLEDLFVVPDYRGRGIGRILLSFLARLAVERGCGTLQWSVMDWNEPAIRFFERLGAQAMDEWTVFRLSGDTLEDLASQSR